MWITCFRFDHVRFFLGLPDFVSEELEDLVLFFRLEGVGTVVDGGTTAEVAPPPKLDLARALAGDPLNG